MFGAASDTVLGRLRIDIPSAFAVRPFITLLGEFRQAYPGVALTLGVSDRLVDMIAEGVDCVLRIGELPSSSLVARRLGSLEMIVCAAPEYLRDASPLGSPDDLSAQACVNFVSGMNKRPLPWHFRKDGKDFTLLPKSEMLVNDATAYVECARPIKPVLIKHERWNHSDSVTDGQIGHSFTDHDDDAGCLIAHGGREGRLDYVATTAVHAFSAVQAERTHTDTHCHVQSRRRNLLRCGAQETS